MTSYDPRSKRPHADDPDAAVSDVGAEESQVDAILAESEPVMSEPESEQPPEEPLGEQLEEQLEESVEGTLEQPPITVTVAQSPVEPAGPPGPGVAGLIAAGASLAALIAGLLAWRYRRRR